MPAARSDIGDVVATRAYVKAAVAQLVGGSVEDEEGGKVLLSDYVKRLAEKLDDLSSRAVQYVVSEDAETGKETRTLTIEGGFLASGVTVDESKKDVKGRLEDLETSVSAYKALTGSDYIDVSGGKVSLKPKVVTTVASGTSTDFVTEGAVVNYVKSREYSLPAATKDALGGIKVGSTLSMSIDNVLNATGEANKIEKVYLTPDSSDPLEVDAARKSVSLPYASTAGYGVVKVANSDASCLRVTDRGVLSCEAQKNVIESVQMPDQANAITPDGGKNVVIPKATSTSCGVVRVDGSTVLIDDSTGTIRSVGEKNLVTDVRDADNVSLLEEVGGGAGTVAVVPNATKTTKGLMSAGDGLKAASGAVSVSVGSGLKIETSGDAAGSVAVDYDTLKEEVGFTDAAKAGDVTQLQTDVSNLTTMVSNFEITSGASDRLRDVEVGADGTVALHDHAVNRVRVGATPKLALRVPASSESTLSRDFYVLFEFTSAYTGEFEVTSVTSPSSGDVIHVYETSTDALGLAGTAKAGSMFLAYFTEVVSGGTFMVSVREIALVSKFEPKGE